MTTSRRSLLAGAALGFGALPFMVNGRTLSLTPAQARQRGVTLRSLTPQEVRTLEAFGDVLLPGSATHGLAHFVDHHVTVPPAESLLIVRNLDIPPPFIDFYRAGLAALDAHARTAYGAPVERLGSEAARALVAEIAQAPPQGWQGPPSPLFYFSVRSDAVDVVYGTQEGIVSLGLPFMPHIVPEQPW